MATWPWPVALRASESPAPDHTGRAGRAFCSRTRGQQGMTAARRSPRRWAASPAQLLARQPPPAICVCFGCTRCAQRWQNHSPPRGGEGRGERRHLAHFQPRPCGAGLFEPPPCRAAARRWHGGVLASGCPRRKKLVGCFNLSWLEIFSQSLLLPFLKLICLLFVKEEESLDLYFLFCSAMKRVSSPLFPIPVAYLMPLLLY